MTINAATEALLKQYEGFSATPYLCPAGVWTIGYGHTNDVSRSTPAVTGQEGEALLAGDVDVAARAVRRYVKAPLNENQFGALVSFVFNLGAGVLRGSTMLNYLNAGRYMPAADEFPRWVWAKRPDGSRVQLPGLIARRAAERTLFLTPVIVADNAPVNLPPPEAYDPELA
jgi:lysozyme